MSVLAIVSVVLNRLIGRIIRCCVTGYLPRYPMNQIVQHYSLCHDRPLLLDFGLLHPIFAIYFVLG